MSYNLVDAAIKAAGLSPSEKLTLVCICHFVYSKGITCYKDQKVLAAYTGLHLTTVSKMIKKLSDKGVISVRNTHKGNSYTPNKAMMDEIVSLGVGASPTWSESKSDLSQEQVQLGVGASPLTEGSLKDIKKGFLKEGILLYQGKVSSGKKDLEVWQMTLQGLMADSLAKYQPFDNPGPSDEELIKIAIEANSMKYTGDSVDQIYDSAEASIPQNMSEEEIIAMGDKGNPHALWNCWCYSVYKHHGALWGTQISPTTKRLAVLKWIGKHHGEKTGAVLHATAKHWDTFRGLVYANDSGKEVSANPFYGLHAVFQYGTLALSLLDYETSVQLITPPMGPETDAPKSVEVQPVQPALDIEEEIPEMTLVEKLAKLKADMEK